MMVAMILTTMDKEEYQKDMTHPSFFRIHRNKKLACLPDGSQSPTMMFRTTPVWSATEELSQDMNPFYRPSSMWVSRIL